MSFARLTRARACAAMLAISVLTACSSTGATFRSGVGDAFPEHPPYYAGVPRQAVGADASRIGHLPIVFQRGASQGAMFDPSSGPGTPTAALLAEMRAYLVRFGCLTDGGMPDDDCTVDDNSALGRGRQQMKLAVGRPSPEWTARMRETMATATVSRAVVITLEVGQMLLRQRGLAGSKELELGTGHTARFPWLTSLETPVAVLQLTGALVDQEGKAIRIGAEAFQAKRTPFLLSSAGAQALLLDEDVTEARTRRREDLPGQPLAWKVALRHLVEHLTGRDLPLR